MFIFFSLWLSCDVVSLRHKECIFSRELERKSLFKATAWFCCSGAVSGGMFAAFTKSCMISNNPLEHGLEDSIPWFTVCQDSEWSCHSVFYRDTSHKYIYLAVCHSHYKWWSRWNCMTQTTSSMALLRQRSRKRE